VTESLDKKAISDCFTKKINKIDLYQ
jgi:hypothetical protein